MDLSTHFLHIDLSGLEKRGIVKSTITSQFPGRVYFQATYWPARLSDLDTHSVLQPDDEVEVLGLDGLTLLIRSLPVSTESIRK